MSLDLVQLGARVRDIRKAAGLTQPELGAKLGISAGAVCQVELGKTAPALAKVAAIADALGVSVSLLLGDRLALAEYTIAPIRAELRVLGYDLALVPRGETAPERALSAHVADEPASAQGADGSGPETGTAGVTDERAREDT